MGGEATIKLHTTLDAHLRAKLSLIMHKEMSRSTHIHTHAYMYYVQNKDIHMYINGGKGILWLAKFGQFSIFYPHRRWPDTEALCLLYL